MTNIFRKSATLILVALFLSLLSAALTAHCEELPVKEKEVLSLSLEDTIRMALEKNRDIKTQHLARASPAALTQHLARASPAAPTPHLARAQLAMR